jgi:hypothetical protein
MRIHLGGLHVFKEGEKDAANTDNPRPGNRGFELGEDYWFSFT